MSVLKRNEQIVPVPVSVVENVTPDLASQYAASNPSNRRLRRHWVKFLAAQMTAGEWVLNGETIVFVGDDLVDGQHRIHAVIESGVTIQTYVVRFPANVNKQRVYESLDQGGKRSASDLFDMMGEQCPDILAAVLKKLDAFYSSGYGDYESRGLTNNKHAISNNRQAARLLQKYPEARLSAIYGKSAYRRGRMIMNAGCWGTVHYILNDIDPTDAEIFLEKLISGSDLRAGDPILVLRNKLIGAMTAPSSARKGFHNRVTIGMCVKAWNAFRQKKMNPTLKMTLGDEMPAPV